MLTPNATITPARITTGDTLRPCSHVSCVYSSGLQGWRPPPLPASRPQQTSPCQPPRNHLTGEPAPGIR
jgi:hypothetical protein